MRHRITHVLLLAVLMSSAVALLAGCGADNTLYTPDLLEKAQEYHGKEVTVQGAYLKRSDTPDRAVLALGVSTLDNGLDAQPIGDQILLEGFPNDISGQLHQPGDAVYGFVQVRGQFESAGSYGPDGQYRYRIQVAAAEPIERVRRNEVRVDSAPLGAGKVALLDLLKDPAKYNDQTVTTQGYYFWNSVIFVLAEGISTEEDGSSPQPVGKVIWMEGFPPDKSSQLHLGPNNSFVWGKVEVTGQFKSGGKFGKDGAYTEFFQVVSAEPLEQVQGQ